MSWLPILTVCVQVTLIAAAGLLVAGLLRSAAHRHSVLLASLLFIVAAPLLYIGTMWAGLSINVAPVFPALREKGQVVSLPAAQRQVRSADSDQGSPGVTVESPEIAFQDVSVSAAVSSSQPVTEEVQHRAAVPTTYFRASWLITGVWLAGTLFSLLGMVRSQLKADGILRTARLVDRSLEHDVVALAEQKLNAVGQLRIATTGKVAGPVVVGVFQPCILMPARYLETLSREELLQVLIHEGAHALRRDPLVALFQRVGSALFWWHPLVHVVNRELTRAREEVCDNFVLTCTEPEEYGATLLRLATLSPAMVQLGLAIGMFDSRGKLENRIEQLLDSRRILMTHVRFVTGATVLCAFGIFSVLIAATRVGAATPAIPSTDDVATVAKEVQTETTKPAEVHDAKQLRLFLTYQGESDKPFYDLILSAPPVSQQARPFTLFHPISVEQAEKILKHLQESQFFEHATMTKADLAPEVKPHYSLRVQFGDASFHESLGWDSATITRLSALRKSFAGDAAKSMDQLLARLNGLRKVWESGEVATISDDDYRLLHDRYQTLILAAAKAGKKKDVEELTEKFNESIGGKLLFVQVTPRVGPLAQHEVMFSKFFDPSRKIDIGKSHFAVSDKPIVLQNHEGQNLVLITTNPLGENKWPNDLQVTLMIDQPRSSETAAYENAIDQVVQKLPADGMWTNGLTPHIGLGADAKPPDVIAEAIKKYTAGNVKPYRVRYIKTVKFAPPIGNVWAALVQDDAGARVLIFYPFQGANGWWTRFYEANFAMPKSASASSIQKQAVYQKAIEQTSSSETSAYENAIDQVVRKLPADGDWTNGKTPHIGLAADAKPDDVIAEAIKKHAPAGDGQPYRVLHVKTVKFTPPVGRVSAALIQNDSGAKVLMFYPYQDGKGWWTRFYETEFAKPKSAGASSVQKHAVYQKAIDQLVAKLAAGGLWNNGRFPRIDLAADAKASEVIAEAMRKRDSSMGVQPYRVLHLQEVTSEPQFKGASAALIQNKAGVSVLLFSWAGHVPGWNWWNRFFEIDLAPELLESSAYGNEMFEQAVDDFNANRRKWELNGRRDTVKLPADAAAKEVIEAALKIANPPFNDIKSFHVVSVRKLESLVAPGTNPWSGALLDTNLGQKILIWGYLNDEAGWWPVLVDAVPAFASPKLNP